MIPELAFFVLQSAFACITCALVIGAFAERVRFAGVLVSTVIWFTLAYLPMAHMVWFFPGPDAFSSNDVAPAVLVTVALSASVSLLAFLLVKHIIGMRVSEEAEREGLDISSHGEAAYEH